LLGKNEEKPRNNFIWKILSREIMPSFTNREQFTVKE